MRLAVDSFDLAMLRVCLPTEPKCTTTSLGPTAPKSQVPRPRMVGPRAPLLAPPQPMVTSQRVVPSTRCSGTGRTHLHHLRSTGSTPPTAYRTHPGRPAPRAKSPEAEP